MYTTAGWPVVPMEVELRLGPFAAPAMGRSAQISYKSFRVKTYQ